MSYPPSAPRKKVWEMTSEEFDDHLEKRISSSYAHREFMRAQAKLAGRADLGQIINISVPYVYGALALAVFGPIGGLICFPILKKIANRRLNAAQREAETQYKTARREMQRLENYERRERNTALRRIAKGLSPESK